jgi:hypothetical protein
MIISGYHTRARVDFSFEEKRVSCRSMFQETFVFAAAAAARQIDMLYHEPQPLFLSLPEAPPKLVQYDELART